MSHFCPHYPKPITQKLSLLKMFFGKQRSWLDGLYERSYQMHMGETKLPGLHLYMVNDPPLVKEILSERANEFPKHELLDNSLGDLLGQSIFTTNGAVWQRQRSMMEPAFSAQGLGNSEAPMQGAAHDFLVQLHELKSNQPVNVENLLSHVTADVIFRTIFSKPLGTSESEGLIAAFATYQSLVPKLALPKIFNLPFLRSPKAKRESAHAAQMIRTSLQNLIAPRYDQYQQTGQTLPDILGAFLQARDPVTGTAFSREELLDQVCMLFLAGHETSASALSWCWYLLAHAPDVQERLHHEIIDAIGDQAQPNIKELLKLELLRNTFREALRLFPPVGFFARQTTHPECLRDKKLGPGAAVLIAPWLIQRHRRYWPKPDAFDPDRYSRQDADYEQNRVALRDAYLPFGMGARVCIGNAFALQEAVLILSLSLRDFELLPVPGHIPKPVGRLTIRSENGIELKLISRSKSGSK
jgi:cytochrome P450